MSDWKKFGMTWGISTLVGFYTVFVITQLWNWFAVPVLHLPEASYWLIYGLNMLFGLMTGVGEQENPADARRWSTLFIVLDTCVPEHKMEELKEAARSGGNVFAVLMDAARVCSLEQITEAFFEVGGQYRRNV